MPSKEFLMGLPLGDEVSQFNAILKYAKENLPITAVVSLTYIDGGFEKVVLRNASAEIFEGQGLTKAEALADCVSKKYPA